MRPNCGSRGGTPNTSTRWSRSHGWIPAIIGLRSISAPPTRCGTSYPAAERWFERAVASAKNKSEALAMIGLQCRNALRYDMAERYLERAGQAPGATPDTLAKLAEMYEPLRRLDKARETVDLALRFDGNNALALLVSARLARSDGNLEESERIRPEFYRSNRRRFLVHPHSRLVRARANLDRQGRYRDAMSAFLSAKAMIRPIAGPAMAEQRMVEAKLKQAEQQITRDVLQRWVTDSNSAVCAAVPALQ